MENDSPKNANDWMPHFNHYPHTARESELHKIAINLLVFPPGMFKHTVLPFCHGLEGSHLSEGTPDLHSLDFQNENQREGFVL